MVTTAQEFEVHIDELPILIPERDLKAFDAESVALVLEFQAHGWTGRMSSNHHAIMRAPDGTATASVARRASRNRAGLNARRPLKQWLRKREREEQRRRNAFGLPAEDLQMASDNPPWRLARKQSYEARLRMQKLARDWWEDVVAAGSGKVIWQLMEDGEDNWMIAAGTREEKIVRIVAIGPAVDPAQVERMRAEAERFNQTEENHPMQEETGPQASAEGLIPCEEPGCGRWFPNKGALALHAQSHNPDGYPCPLCDKVMGSAAARGGHVRGKEHADDPRLPQALAMLKKGRSTIATHPKKKGAPARACEYCGEMKPALSIGGHHRGHKLAGDIKLADRGVATQTVKATTAPETPTQAVAAATAPPAPPEPLVVQAAPIATTTEPASVNGTGHAVMPTDLLNQVRALVNPELVGDLERLRARCEQLETDLEAMTKDRDELQALMDMISERRARTNANT